MTSKKLTKATTKKAQGPENLKQLEEQLSKKVQKAKINAQVKLDSQGVAIEFKDGMLFQSGSANSNPRFRKVVGDIIKIIGAAPKKYNIKIEGHTDDTPIRGKYSNNWELSAARGISLLKLMNQRGVSESRMTVVAHADTKPKYSIQGLKGENLRRARAANRRVVIRIF
jgi:chemotaxis protein MotB